MNESDHGLAGEPAKWLLLIHQLPAKPAYLRVKIWRRLQALGSVTVKNSVYALPAVERTQEDLEWLLKEIVAAGGEGLICEARVVGGMPDREIRDLFNAAREADYRGLADEIRALATALGASGQVDTEVVSRVEARIKLARLRTQAEQIEAIDFFGANGREVVEALARELAVRLREDDAVTEAKRDQMLPDNRMPKGRIWVTRQGVHVDRIATAWLVRRFIDPEARFKFVSPKGYTPESGELRFDMYDGEFTHEGDHCTFETLLAHAGCHDPALTAIAEIVHDIDLKDAKFGREEAHGIAHLIAGLVSANDEDSRRLELGALVFDNLYEFFRRRR